MKTLTLILVCTFGLMLATLAADGDRVPVPATQVEVNNGQVKTKYVTPDSLGVQPNERVVCNPAFTGHAGYEGGTTLLTNFLFRMGYITGSNNVRDLRVVIGNAVSAGVGTEPTNGYWVHMAQEFPDGSIRRVLWNGAYDVYVPPSGILVSDTLWGDYPALSTNIIRGFGWVVGLGRWPKGYAAQSNPFWSGSGYYSGTNNISDLTLGGTIAANTAFGYAPIALVGSISNNTPVAPILGYAGDSWGQVDIVNYGCSLYDLVGLWRHQPSLNLSQSGACIEDFSTIPTNAVISEWLTFKYCDTICEALGNNNYAGNRGVTTTNGMVSALLYFYQQIAARGKGLAIFTIPPFTTSTDSFTTTNNQTVTANEANRVWINNWKRGYASNNPTCTLVDLADCVETARNSGKWQAFNGVAMTGDGRHPTTLNGVVIATNLYPRLPSTFKRFIYTAP